ncbi:hypothetical protein RFM68_20990 [Mesorhizobium sp. MSK_1335]|uniref:Uncharacterized protein n=1 Tax=Mesorhizobium montanum TaxID=3072323 RepID=A0ABU4ZNM1_9HYPH|nr:hypothetical protein [Mesorhizobium sp. MSK_1335]MDX8526981.1 hypothetical protein [Mesorhizobium sp. MSK_1335]
MSDGPASPGHVIQLCERGLLGHICDHTDCSKDAGWGFARPKQAAHWFCFEHRDQGEKFL